MLSYRRPFLSNVEGSLWKSITCKMEHVEGIFIDKQKKTRNEFRLIHFTIFYFYVFSSVCSHSWKDILLSFLYASTFFVWFVDPLMENFVSNRFLSLMNWCSWHFLGEKSFEIEKKRRIYFSHKKWRILKGLKTEMLWRIQKKSWWIVICLLCGISGENSEFL